MGEFMAEGKPGRAKSRFSDYYIIVFSIIGISLAFYLSYQCIGKLTFSYKEILQYAVLIFALSICRSMPLPTRSGQGMDISIIILYATVVIMGIEATMLIFIVSAFFTFSRWNGKKVSHLFNTPVKQTLFNNANYILSIYLGYLAYCAVGGHQGNPPLPSALPEIIWQSLVLLVVTLFVDSVNIFTILKLTARVPFFRSLAGGIASMLPTLLAFAPIGYFLALIFGMDGGPYMALLFFVPLLFARYAFKLYLDSKEQYLRVISTLTAAIEAKDEYTEGHSKRVAQVSEEIAKSMRLRSARIENIKVAAVLHDVGKIGIEDKILRKPSKLNDYEWGKIMEHPQIGVKILEEVAMPAAVREIILYHHVRYDGKGYPKVERTKPLPMEVHIVSLADAYDAMTSDRPYRKALSEETALGIIAQEKGTQFHPDIVDVFLKMKKEVASKI
jgi:putative nucleotidyltransferase with HDIG domain